MKPITLALSLFAVALSLAAASAPKPEARKIPLDSIYSTSQQKGLKHSDDAPVLDGDFAGAPAIHAFGWAKDLKSLKKDSLVPAATSTADKPQSLTKPADAETQLWAVITFGSNGSNPPQFILDSVTVTDKGAIEVAYHQVKGGISTRDLFPYIYWIPLGKTSDKPTLRLVNAGKTVAEQFLSITEKPAK